MSEHTHYAESEDGESLNVIAVPCTCGKPELAAIRADNDVLRHALTQIAEWLERGRVMYSDTFMSSETRRVLKETEP